VKPRYRVALTPKEPKEPEALTWTARTNAKRFLYARALLLCDAGPSGPAWAVADTAEAMGVTARTIEHLKKRFAEEGLGAALERSRKPEKPPRAVTFDGAFRGAADCPGLLRVARGPQTLDRTAARGKSGGTQPGVDGVPYDGTANPKKNELKPHLRKYWKIPPKESAAFVAAMEDVLAIYELPYEPQRPVVCMDILQAAYR